MKLLIIHITVFAVWVVTSSTPPPFAFTSLTLGKGEMKTGCIKVNHCKCIMMDGSGVINLSGLGNSDGYLERFKPIQSEDAQLDADLFLSFSPCLPFSEPEDFENADCLVVAACLIVKHLKFNYRYMNYGRHEGNIFEYNITFQTLTVTYSASPQRQTRVHYHCSPHYSSKSTIQPWADMALDIWVDSPCACANTCSLEDMGPGTIFLIIICLSAAAYFILGSCALHPFRTHGGMHITPEHNLWCGLCYLFTEHRGQWSQRHHPLKEETMVM